MKVALVLYLLVSPGVFQPQPASGYFPSVEVCEAVKKTMRVPDQGGYYVCMLSW